MSLKEKLFDSNVSRRSFLKGMAAVGTTAALYGCGSGGDGAQEYERILQPSDNLNYDKELRAVSQGHPFNCGSRCNFKVFVKNGRMVSITSAGDIPREGAYSDADGMDESVNLPQRRACPKGYGQIKRTYQPDRLKYPMKQTKKRGDISGFQRITWEEAINEIADNYISTIARQGQLGYIPGMGGLFPFFGPSLMLSGAPSYENAQMAMTGATGNAVQSNYVADILNSELIIYSGIAAATSFSWVPHIFWFLTKAKEKGIPVISINPEYTDSEVNLTSEDMIDGIPPYLAIKPEGDAALYSAMAYVIYDEDLVDHDFLEANSFAYYDDPDNCQVIDPETEQPIEDKTVDPALSFERYLKNLPANSKKDLEGIFSIDADSIEDDRKAVLTWAECKTGIKKDIIEKLAIKYATTKPAALFGGFGQGRSGNGFFAIWLTIGLSAMTGNFGKSGGSIGVAPGSFGGPLSLYSDPYPEMYPIIYFSANSFGKVLLTGIDSRDPLEMRDDTIEWTNNLVDLGKFTKEPTGANDGRLRIEMISYDHTNNTLNQRGTINDRLIGLENVKFSYAVDNFITPTLAHSDIILPVTTHMEEYRIEDGFGLVPYAIFLGKAIEPMYDCKTNGEITYMILSKIQEKMGLTSAASAKLSQLKPSSDEDPQLAALRDAWSKSSVNPLYKMIYPNETLPTFEEFMEKGIYELPLSPEQAATLSSFISSVDIVKNPATGSDTQKINFISPRYYYRNKKMVEKWKGAYDGDYLKKFERKDVIGEEELTGYYRSAYLPGARYAPAYEGDDDIVLGKVGYSGKKYTLQMKTGHARERAHSVYDNVAVVKDQFTFTGTQDIYMNATDAAERGIKHGDLVYAYNDWGCVKVRARVTKRLRRGTINLADGGWYRPSSSETYTVYIDLMDATLIGDASNLPELDGVSYKIETPEHGIYAGKPRVVMIKSVPVDVGGAPNSLMQNADVNTKDPFVSLSLGSLFMPFLGDNCWNGHLVEISKNHPER